MGQKELLASIEQGGQASRNIIGRGKDTELFSNILGTMSTILSFGTAQAKRVETAWDEYEAGFEALGGDPADIPKRPSFFKQIGQTLVPGGETGFFGEQGYFKMPEGEVTVNNRIYDMEKIREAGSLLNTPAGQSFEEETRDAYLKRTVPGRDIPEPIVDTGVGTSSLATSNLKDQNFENKDNIIYNTLDEIYNERWG